MFPLLPRHTASLSSLTVSIHLLRGPGKKVTTADRQLGERGKEEEEMRKRMDLGQVNAGSGGVGPGALTI